MLSRTALRASPSSILARRGFHTTRSRLSSPYHYPEGPRTNIPFNPKAKYFAFTYWGTMGKLESWATSSSANRVLAFFFGLPFMIAGTFAVLVAGIMASNVMVQCGNLRRTSRASACIAGTRGGLRASRQEFRNGSCTKSGSNQSILLAIRKISVLCTLSS